MKLWKINTSNEKDSKKSQYKMMKCLHTTKVQMGIDTKCFILMTFPN
jgi:hypothetical protein